MLPAGDAELVHIVDAALNDAALRAGHWLACRPGCNQCCTGVFRISQLDAARLRHGFDLLVDRDATAAAQLRRRILASRSSLAESFPGNANTGILFEDDKSDEVFATFADNAICPELDPISGTCTLYQHRPMTCRTFGPPVATDDGGLGTCELCFQGASDEAVKQAELYLPPAELESSLTAQLPRDGHTIVAFAFDVI